MLVLACEVHDLGHLGFGDLVGIDTALPYSMLMDMEHYVGRLLPAFLKKLLEHKNDELHGSVIVIQEQHAIQRRTFGAGACLGDNAGAGIVIKVRWANRVAHVRHKTTLAARCYQNFPECYEKLRGAQPVAGSRFSGRLRAL